MRRTALLLVTAVCGYAAEAQFTLKPQAGVELPSTKISYNNLPYFKPECQASGQFGLRGDYQFKGGFGPFLGVVTHRPLVSYNFTDPKTGMTNYNATEGDLQVQLQAGVQYSSKPISLSKKSSPKTTATQNTTQTEKVYYSSCGKKYTQIKTCGSKKDNKKDQWTMRLQPSAGIGYVPSGKTDMATYLPTSAPGYTYNAGNVSTELIGGMGFEFARNKTKVLTLSVNYFQGLANNETSFTTQTAADKQETTTLRSKVSGWNASVGVPITFSKKSAAKKSTTKKNNSKCGSYYKSKCGF